VDLSPKADAMAALGGSLPTHDGTTDASSSFPWFGPQTDILSINNQYNDLKFDMSLRCRRPDGTPTSTKEQAQLPQCGIYRIAAPANAAITERRRMRMI